MTSRQMKHQQMHLYMTDKMYDIILNLFYNFLAPSKWIVMNIKINVVVNIKRYLISHPLQKLNETKFRIWIIYKRVIFQDIFNPRKSKNELNRKEMRFYNAFIAWKLEIRSWTDRIFTVRSEQGLIRRSQLGEKWPPRCCKTSIVENVQIDLLDSIKIIRALDWLFV